MAEEAEGEPSSREQLEGRLLALCEGLIRLGCLHERTVFAPVEGRHHAGLGRADIPVDSRPSDAIALALRVGAPIFVDEEVVHKARTLEGAKETEIGTGKGDDPAKIKEWLESLKPGDFDRIERGKDPNRPDE